MDMERKARNKRKRKETSEEQKLAGELRIIYYIHACVRTFIVHVCVGIS